MTADTLRRAATLMRERAEAANEIWIPTYWRAIHADAPYADGMRTSDLDKHYVATDDEHGSILLTSPWDETQVVDHAASWHPAVALAVADLLDRQAGFIERGGDFSDVEAGGDASCLAVARAYLGEES